MNKNAVWVLYIAAVLAMLLSDGGLATAGLWVLIVLAVVHFAEFVAKRDVMARAGGSMGNHFVQTMIYGFLHWKPLEDAQKAES